MRTTLFLFSMSQTTRDKVVELYMGWYPSTFSRASSLLVPVYQLPLKSFVQDKFPGCLCKLRFSLGGSFATHLYRTSLSVVLTAFTLSEAGHVGLSLTCSISVPLTYRSFVCYLLTCSVQCIMWFELGKHNRCRFCTPITTITSVLLLVVTVTCWTAALVVTFVRCLVRSLGCPSTCRLTRPSSAIYSHMKRLQRCLGSAVPFWAPLYRTGGVSRGFGEDKCWSNCIV